MTKINLLCPSCGATLIKRTGKHGVFYGCSMYPKCNTTVSERAYKDKLQAAWKVSRYLKQKTKK